MRTLAVLFALLFAGCSMQADTKAAEQAVPRFHDLVDAGQFEVIYAESGEEFRKSISQDKFFAFIGAVHRKLGPVKATKPDGWFVNYNTSGTFVTLNYATTFVEGEGAEQFVFRLSGDKAVLVGYHINSSELIVK
jgi:hypothetical protein